MKKTNDQRHRPNAPMLMAKALARWEGEGGALSLQAQQDAAPAFNDPNRAANEETNMSDPMFSTDTRAAARRRQDLRPETEAAFQAFSKTVFAEGALSAKTKQIIAVAAAHVTQCPYCIKGHTKAALRHGATDEELMEAIWVATEMRAGAAYAHSALALEEMEKHAASKS